MGVAQVPADALRVPPEGMADDPLGWTLITLKAPWVNVSGAGGANPQAGYRVGLDGRVYLRGWIRGATARNQPIWDSVPVGAPAFQDLRIPTMFITQSTLQWKLTVLRMFTGTAHYDVSLDATPSGDIPDTLILDGISWRPTSAPLGSGPRALGAMPADASILPTDFGTSYGNLAEGQATVTAPRIQVGGTYPPFGYERDAQGYVRLVGVVGYSGATPAYPFTLGVLPAPVRPLKRCAMTGFWHRVRNAGANDYGSFRVDVLPDGSVNAVSGDLPAAAESGVYMWVEGLTFALGRVAGVYSQSWSQIIDHYTVDEATEKLTNAGDGPAAGLTASCVAMRPDGDYLYSADQTSNQISQYGIAPNGTPVPLSPAAVATGSSTSPVWVTVSPNGLRLYVLNQGTNVVAWYNIGTDGKLSAVAGTVATGSGPLSAAISPDGLSLYVTNFTAGTISQYDVGGGGGLTAKTPASVVAGAKAAGIAVSPDGKSLYVTGQTTPAGSLYAYDIDPANGRLTPKATPVYNGLPANPRGLTVSPDGKSLYLGFSSGNVVLMYDIDASGNLTPKSTPSVASGGAPFTVFVTSDGLSAYAPNFSDATISQYDVDPATGILIPKSPATASATFRPMSMAARALPGTKFGGLRSDQVLPISQRPLPAPILATLADPAFTSYDGGAVYGNPSYYKDGRGMVHLSGMLKSSGLGSGVEFFTLPAGFRPSKKALSRVLQSEATVTAGAVPMECEVGTDGSVVTNGVNGASGSAFTSLEGVTFLAEQ